MEGMDWGPAGIISGASMIGSLIQGANANQQAQKQMDFQREMSSTAVQRRVADMKAAGINPMLAAGGEASSPQGAMGSMENPMAGVSTGIETAIAKKQAEKTQDLQDAQISNTGADTATKYATQALIQNQQASTAKDIEQKSMQNKILSQTLDSQIKKAKAEGDYSEVNQLMNILNSGASSANQLLNPLKFIPKGK